MSVTYGMRLLVAIKYDVISRRYHISENGVHSTGALSLEIIPRIPYRYVIPSGIQDFR
jgi:hypothetical protein